jgi:hypothetical protein
MKHFTFLEGVSKYDGLAKDLRRLELRHSFLIDPFRDQLANADVLDIGAHDGRWSYALAAAGAKSVLGLEARQDMVDYFDRVPGDTFKQRVTLEVCDLHKRLDTLSSEGRKFDVIALFGIMYHVMDHFSILKRCLELQPKAIIIDSEFMKGNNPYIQLIREATAKPSNAAPQVKGQEMAVIGVPSSLAMERMSDALDCDLTWMPWENLPEQERFGVGDYFRGEGKRMIRRTCALTPRQS